MSHVKNKNGFSLLEITLSISILSIIFLVFFGYFIQANKFTDHNQDTGTASQLSQEVLAKALTSGLTSQELTNYTNGIVVNGQKYYVKIQEKRAIDKMKEYPENSNGYLNVVEYLGNLLSNLLSGQDLIKAEITKSLQNMMFVKVEVLTDRDGSRVEIFETYGYKKGA